MKTMTRALFVASFMLANTVSAASITLQNSSFESPVGDSPNGLFDAPDGNIGAWSYSRSGLLAPTLTDVSFASSALATDGSNVAALSFLVGAVGGITLYQDTGVSWLPDTTYTLTFDADQISTVSLLSEASVSLFGGATPIATLNSGSLLSLLDGTGGLNQISLQFATSSIAPTGTLGVQFAVGGVAEVLGAGLVIDNVALDATPTPTPEPGSALLASFASIWLIVSRRRHHQLLNRI